VEGLIGASANPSVSACALPPPRTGEDRLDEKRLSHYSDHFPLIIGFAVTLYARFADHIDAILSALEAEGSLAAGVERKGVAGGAPRGPSHGGLGNHARSEEQTSEIQAQVRNSYGVLLF